MWISRRMLLFIGSVGEQKGEYRAFVPANTHVTEIHSVRLPADGSSFSIQGAIGFHPPSLRQAGFYGCSAECESTYANQVRQAFELESRALQEPNPERANALRNRAAEIRHRASAALHFCVSNCPNPPRWRWKCTPGGGCRLVPFSLSEWVAEIMDRSL